MLHRGRLNTGFQALVPHHDSSFMSHIWKFSKSCTHLGFLGGSSTKTCLYSWTALQYIFVYQKHNKPYWRDASCCNPHLSLNTVNSSRKRTNGPYLAYLACRFCPTLVLSVVGFNQITIEGLDISWLRLHSFCILPLHPWQSGCHGLLAEQQVHLKTLQNL